MRKQAVSGATGSPMQWLEQIAHLVADELNEAVLIELGGKRLGDAIDGHELRCAFADLVLALVDRLICAGIIECDGGICG